MFFVTRYRGCCRYSTLTSAMEKYGRLFHLVPELALDAGSTGW